MTALFSATCWWVSAFSFASVLAIPGGYSFAVAALFIMSILSLPFLIRKLAWERADVLLVCSFAVFCMAMFGFVYLDGWHVRELDRPSRFLLVLPVLILLLKARLPSAPVLFYGVSLGAILSCYTAIHDVFILGMTRARGVEHPIMFGDTSMLLGLLSCVAAMYFFSRKSWWWLVISVCAVIAGIAGSLLSGSRGGWVALPLIGVFLLWQSRALFGQKWAIGIAASAVTVAVIVFVVPQTGVQARIAQALDDVERYQQGDVSYSSVGQRFEMWKGAVYLFAEAPMLGVGKYTSKSKKADLAEQGLIAPEVVMRSHAHNEYLNALSLTGIVGFVVLMLVYLVPMKLFLNKIRQYPHQWEIKAYAMAGALVPMSYMDFALTQSMFSHNIGVMMYAFPIVFFWGAMRWAERRSVNVANREKI